MNHLHRGGTDPYHLWHESAAWNVAIGAGFLWIAVRRARPAGLMPTLTAFVAVLAVLSANDIVAGSVDSARLISHGLLLLGYLVLTVSHRRDAGDPGQPPAGRDRTSRWRARFDEESAPAPSRPALRLVRGLPPNASGRRASAYHTSGVPGTARPATAPAAERRGRRAA